GPTVAGFLIARCGCPKSQRASEGAQPLLAGRAAFLGDAVKAGMDGGGCFPSGRHYPGIAHLLRIVVTGLAPGCDPTTRVVDLPMVCIDTETTGREAEKDRIIEVGCAIARQGQVTERVSWLVHPQQPIPQESTAVHGIRDEDVQGQPAFAEIAPQILAFLDGLVPVAYNAEFDRRFLLAELRRARLLTGSLPAAMQEEVEWLDPLIWARELQKYEKGKSLGEVCARLGVELDRAHRAADDAAAALAVLLQLCKDPRVPQQYSAFVMEQRRLGREYEQTRRLWRTRSTPAGSG
ncbi:exonuclease domain-containing protein, partial [Myxococcota bacterium]